MECTSFASCGKAKDMKFFRPQKPAKPRFDGRGGRMECTSFASCGKAKDMKFFRPQKPAKPLL